MKSLLRFIRPLVLIAAAVILVAFLPLARAAEPAPSAPQPSPAAPPTAPIPLSEVAERTAEVTHTLQNLKAYLTPGSTIQEIKAQLENLRRDIDADFEVISEMLRTSPTLEKLQTEQKLWQGRHLLASGWLKTLTGRANEVKSALDRLHENEKIWRATRDAAAASNASGQILQQIDVVNSLLEAVRVPLADQLSNTLDLQAAVAKEMSRCESVFSQVIDAQKQEVGGLLTRGAPPIWSAALWSEGRGLFIESIRRSIIACWGEVHRYVWGTSMDILMHIGLFFGMGLLFRAAGLKAHRWTLSEERGFSGLEVFDFPWSAAYLASIIFITGPISSTPETVKSLLKVSALLPMIRFVSPLGPRVMIGAYIAGILFVLEGLRELFDGTPLLEQLLLILEMSSGIAVLAWAKARGCFKPVSDRVEGSVLQQMAPTAAVLLYAILYMGLAAGVLGYMLLARIFASAVLPLGFLVLLLYSYLRILQGLVTIALHTRPLMRLRLVQNHRRRLMRRAYGALVWLAVATGMVRFLDQLGLFQPALDLMGDILTAKLTRGTVSISLGDILEFILTVWVAYLLSTFLRFVLREDVYPRLGVPVGLSYAASSLLHYMILALGVMVGLGILGVDLTRVTVLAGALGVGIGFGLQSVVNNFVSGLILLFERPIHVGDSIEVGDDVGEVRRIGIRASTIRTRQGAEIIIPNAQLVTEKVTNWTLTDQLRRIELPVGVNYGAHPKEVIEMLEKIARAHPKIIQNPAPYGLLVGFGDSSIDFELRVWTDEFADWARIRSDLALAIHDAVAEKGWEFPFPQQEVRLLNFPTSS
jgi:potassium-dependent mechanosensitive channel